MSRSITEVVDLHQPGVVESTIQRSSHIATLPGVAAQIIRLCEKPDAAVADLNEIISADPVLGIRILKLVNSAYYGMSGKISSIQRAVVFLGLKAVKNVAIAASLVNLVRGGHVNSHFDAEDLWTHSVAVATASRILAHHTGLVTEDEAFLAGLIHDMGIVVEMQCCGPHFVTVINRLHADEALTFRRAEEEVLGASHEAFGAGLCQAWNFPELLQFVTGYHHRPWELSETHRGLPSLVHIADVLAARMGLGYTRTVETDSLDRQLLSDINLTEADLAAVAKGLPEAVHESQQLLSDG